MKNMVRVRYILLTLFFGAFAVVQSSAQMKIGNHPTQIEPFSILALESKNQALRLTQGDTAQVNTIINGASSLPDGNTASSEAEGLIMYQLSDSSFYLRSHGYWHRILTSNNENQYFQLGGNTITQTKDSSIFLGTTTSDTLNIGTNKNTSVVILPTGVIKLLDSLNAVLARVNKLYSGVASIDTLTVNDTLSVAGKLLVKSDSTKVLNVFQMQDSVVMSNLMNAYGADTALLSISPNGVVHKMSLDSLLIANTTTINGIKSNVFHLKMDSLAAGQTHPWIDSSDVTKDSTIIFHIPIATQTVQGIVNTSTQTFGGTKSFADSVAIGQTGTPNSTLQVTGNISMADSTVTAGSTYNMATASNTLYRTIIFNVNTIGSGVTVTLPDAATITGRIYTFKKIGLTTDGQIGDPVTINTSSGTQTIDGDTTTFTLYNNFTSVTLQAEGSGWLIIGH